MGTTGSLQGYRATDSHDTQTYQTQHSPPYGSLGASSRPAGHSRVLFSYSASVLSVIFRARRADGLYPVDSRMTAFNMPNQ